MPFHFGGVVIGYRVEIRATRRSTAAPSTTRCSRTAADRPWCTWPTSCCSRRRGRERVRLPVRPGSVVCNAWVATSSSSACTSRRRATDGLAATVVGRGPGRSHRVATRPVPPKECPRRPDDAAGPHRRPALRRAGVALVVGPSRPPRDRRPDRSGRPLLVEGVRCTGDVETTRPAPARPAPPGLTSNVVTSTASPPPGTRTACSAPPRANAGVVSGEHRQPRRQAPRASCPGRQPAAAVRGSGHRAAAGAVDRQCSSRGRRAVRGDQARPRRAAQPGAAARRAIHHRLQAAGAAHVADVQGARFRIGRPGCGR